MTDNIEHAAVVVEVNTTEVVNFVKMFLDMQFIVMRFKDMSEILTQIKNKLTKSLSVLRCEKDNARNIIMDLIKHYCNSIIPLSNAKEKTNEIVDALIKSITKEYVTMKLIIYKEVGKTQ